MDANNSATDLICRIYAKAAAKVLSSVTGETVTHSKTTQVIPKIGIRPDIGCFAQFTGDYNGLVVLNLPADSAIAIYQKYMINMGIPKEELKESHNIPEVPDSIGEILNQIIGRAAQAIEKNLDINAMASQPRALSINTAITLIIDSDYRDNRRIALRMGHHKFSMELAIETLKFRPL